MQPANSLLRKMPNLSVVISSLLRVKAVSGRWESGRAATAASPTVEKRAHQSNDLEEVVTVSPVLSLFDLVGGVASRSAIGGVDAFERDGALHLRIDLPGVSRDNVELLVDERSVRIRADRPMGPDPTDRVFRQERPFGVIERMFRLHRPLDAEATTADLVDGVLEIRVPFADATSGPRRIEVGTGSQLELEAAAS